MAESEASKQIAEFDALMKLSAQKPAALPQENIILTPFVEVSPKPPLKKKPSIATPSEPVAPPSMTDIPCFNKPFKNMLKALMPEYIGNPLAKDFLVDLIDNQLPECG